MFHRDREMRFSSGRFSMRYLATPILSEVAGVTDIRSLFSFRRGFFEVSDMRKESFMKLATACTVSSSRSTVWSSRKCNSCGVTVSILSPAGPSPSKWTRN